MGSIGEQALVANAMWARAVAASLRVRVSVCPCVRVFAWPENVTQRRVNWRHMVVFLTSEFVVTIVAVVLIRGITAQAFGNGTPSFFQPRSFSRCERKKKNIVSLSLNRFAHTAAPGIGGLFDGEHII